MSPDFDFEFFACISWDLGSVSEPEPVSEPESVGAGDGGGEPVLKPAPEPTYKKDFSACL